MLMFFRNTLILIARAICPTRRVNNINGAAAIEKAAAKQKQARSVAESEALLRKLGEMAQAADDGQNPNISKEELQSLLSLVPPMAKRPKV